MKNFKYYLAVLAGLFFAAGVAHGVDPTLFKDVLVTSSLKIGGSGPANVKSALEINSTTKGLLLPRLTTTQRNAITSVPTGLQVYDTTIGAIYVYNGSNWVNTIGQTGYTVGDLVYASTTSALSKLGIGAGGTVLKSYNSLPVWSSNGLIGDRELISNTDADIDATGYTAYADAAGAVPVDGTGGSPSSTITRTTSDPITGVGSLLWTKAGSANRQGEGFSIPITISPADQGRNLEITFDYMVASGTFTPGVDGASPTDSDLELFVYDTTNSRLIPTTTYKLYSSSTSPPIQTVSSFPAPTCTPQPCTIGARLIWHTATTTTNNFTLKIDNISIHPPRGIGGTSIVTDWQSYTPTLAGFGTVTNLSAYWRRVGNAIELQATWTNGTAAASTASITLPNNLTASVPSQKTVGKLTRGGAAGESALLAQAASNTIQFGSNGSSTQLTAQTGSSISTTSENLSLFSTAIPITGWTSSGQAVRADQTNTGWTAWTPTFTNWGTVTNSRFFWRRNGENLEVSGNVTTGTTVGTLWSMTLPGSLTIDASKLGILANTTANPGSKIGWAGQNAGGGNAYWSIVTAPGTSTSLVYFGAAAGASTQFTPTNGNSFSSTSVTYVEFKVPIVGWTESQGAPVLIGSVTSNAQNAERIERAYITNSGTPTVSTQSGAWISSLTDNGTGDTTINIASGIFSATPTCTCTVAASGFACAWTITGASASLVRFATFNLGGAASDQGFTVHCIGPR